jgi:enamine deaminase RidA (YjgF/YER057c/UK114 family)
VAHPPQAGESCPIYDNEFLGFLRTDDIVASWVVEHGDMVYLCGVTPELEGDITTQTRHALERVDRLLAVAGTDKSRILAVQVWLADMSLLAAHDAVWNDWLHPAPPPVRACARADLWRPGMLVEIMVTARK